MAKQQKFPKMLYVYECTESMLVAVEDAAECLCEDEDFMTAGVYHLDHTVTVERQVLITPTSKKAATKKGKKKSNAT